VRGATAYAVREAFAGLRRDWRSAGLALLVIAAAVLVTGTLLVALRVADRVLSRLTEGADVSVFLALDATPAVREDVEQALRASAQVKSFTFVSSEVGAERLRAAYPDLAPLLAEGFALPASFDVTLVDGRAEGAAVEPLLAGLRAVRGVDQVRYDRELARRAAGVARIVRAAGGFIAAMLALAGALAVFSVIRLAYVARRDEVEILYLVGAPLVAIRGPFLVEGALQGALGAALGVLALAVGLGAARARVGEVLSSALGSTGVLALPATHGVALVLAASALGATAAALAWRSASRTSAT
jgi:cell division transport system permease protein